MGCSSGQHDRVTRRVPGSRAVLGEEAFPKGQGEAAGHRVVPDRHSPAGVTDRV